jgi:hypothetical protein
METEEESQAALTQEIILRKPVHNFHICGHFDIFGPLRTITIPYHPLREVGKGTIQLIKEFWGLIHAQKCAQSHKDKSRFSNLGNKVLQVLEGRRKERRQQSCFRLSKQP